jgi:hypothetical protein
VLFSILLLLVPFAALAQDFCKGNFDYDKDVDGSDASTFKQGFGRSALKNPCPADGPTPVEKTWQTTSYATGDDGELEKGVAWTNPRFTVLYHYWDESLGYYAPCNPPTVECSSDHAGDMVLDNLTGLYWTRNARFGEAAFTWAEAVNEPLANGHFVGGYTDWRLPNVKELQSLIDFSHNMPALPSGHPFVNVQSDYYWSSTTVAINPTCAWSVYMDYNRLGNDDKYYYDCVWPVRGGQ